MSTRLLWEQEYSQPSLGNPLFENVPIEVHQEYLMARHLALGGGVHVGDKGITLTDKPGEVPGDTEDDGRNWPVYTGDRELDNYERRVALGLGPMDDGQPDPVVH